MHGLTLIALKPLVLLPPRLQPVRNLQQVQHLPHHEVHQIRHPSGVEVKTGIRRTDGRARQRQLLHVADVNEGQRHLAVADDERSAFLERNHCRAAEQVAPAARGDLAQGSRGAGEDDHSVVEKTAGGNDRAHVLVGVDKEASFEVLGVGAGGKMGKQPLEGDRANTRFIEEQAAAVVADNQVNLVLLSEEEFEQAKRVGGSRRAGDPENELAGKLGQA